MIRNACYGMAVMALALLSSCKTTNIRSQGTPASGEPSYSDALTVQLVEILDAARASGDVRLMGRTLIALAEVGDGTYPPLKPVILRVEAEYGGEVWPIGVGYDGIYDKNGLWSRSDTGFGLLIRRCEDRLLDRGFSIRLRKEFIPDAGPLPSNCIRNWPVAHRYEFSESKVFAVFEDDWYKTCIEIDLPSNWK